MNRQGLRFGFGKSGRKQKGECYEEKCAANHARRIPLSGQAAD
jgi:hypothetical protein